MKILLSTDGSEYSEGAARFLTRLNLPPLDEVHILHVISEIPYEDEWKPYYSGLRHLMRDIAPKILDSTEHVLRPVKAKVNKTAVEGYPDTAILSAAEEIGAELIVMGARGVKGVKMLILGSSTRAVAIKSIRPVLVVKLPIMEPGETMHVLYATDGSECAKATAQILNSMPFPEGAKLTIINVVPPALSDIPERFALEIDDRIKDAVARARKKEFAGSEKVLEDAKSSLGGKFKDISCLSKSGEPSVEILNAAEILKMDIIAVGSRGLRGIKGMLGSISRNILGHSKCSVLIGKEEQCK
jgi:nucleotide-binding universal stress UspA family protein